MTSDDHGTALEQDRPPYEAWFVIEVDIERDRDNPLFTSIRGPFATKEKAEQERNAQQEAWQNALDEWDDGNPYDFKGWDIVEKHISDFQIERLDRQDGESYRITQEAVGAVGASLLADEGIGPMAGDGDG